MLYLDDITKGMTVYTVSYRKLTSPHLRTLLAAMSILAAYAMLTED